MARPPRASDRSPAGAAPSLPDVAPPWRAALVVAGAYAAVAGLWLAFSEPFIGTIAPTPAVHARLLGLERWVFAAITTAALFGVLRFQLRRRIAPIRELRLAYERLHRHATGTPLALIESDGDFRVREWSARAEKLFGWTAAEAIGRSWEELGLLHPEEQEAHDRFRAGLGDRRPEGILLVRRHLDRDGGEIWCEWYVSWRRDRSGEVHSIFTLVRDVTADREAMARIQAQNRELEVRIAQRTRELAAARRDLQAFTHSLAHDLRSPVHAVIDFAENLRTGAGDGITGEARRQLVYLTAAGKQLDNLIEDLLEYARLGAHRPERRPVEIVEVARRVVRSLEESFPEAPSVVSLPRSAVTFVADPELFERVLHNLLENALQYRDPHRPPKIRVDVGWSEREVKVRVQDNGIGVAPDDRERVFRLFERLQSRESHPGSGMGLAVVRKAMDLMGGTAAIEGQTGPGTTVVLRFPGRGDVLDLTIRGEQPGHRTRDGEMVPEGEPGSERKPAVGSATAG